jgi:hypothetical protein
MNCRREDRRVRRGRKRGRKERDFPRRRGEVFLSRKKGVVDNISLLIEVKSVCFSNVYT